MPLSPIKTYISLLSLTSGELGTKQKKNGLIAYARLVTFICFIAGGLYAIFHSLGTILAAIACFSLILFIVLITISGKLNSRIKFLKKLILLYQNEISVIKGETNMHANGAEFICSKHPYSADLDMFGNNSIFHHLNRTSTKVGYKALANRLLNQCIVEKEIIANQSAIKELSKHLEWCVHFLATGRIAYRDRIPKTSSWIREGGANPADQTTVKVLLWAVPLFNWVFISAILYFHHSYLYIGLPLIWSSIISLSYRKKINLYEEKICSSAQQLSSVSKQCSYLESKVFVSDTLNLIQSVLKSGPSTASMEIKKLCKLAMDFQIGAGPIKAIILNAAFLWEIQCLYRSNQWEK